MDVQQARLAINATLQQLQERYAKNPPEKEQLKALYDKFYNDLIALNAGALDAAADAVAQAAQQLQAIVASASTSPFDDYLRSLQQVAMQVGVLLPPPPASPTGPSASPPTGAPSAGGGAVSTPPATGGSGSSMGSGAGGATGSAPAASASVSTTTANRDVSLLHPLMRDRAQKVLAACAQQQLPFRIFEAWRAPERQRYLFEQGRSRPGGIVTYADAWQSYHQYGLAADFVLYLENTTNPWSWDDAGSKKAMWDALHQIGRGLGLEPLGFETPHLQVAGLKIGDLMAGDLPDGDATWRTNLASAANRWSGSPSSPNLSMTSQRRPTLSVPPNRWSDSSLTGSSDWHSQFGGQEWRFDQSGVFLRSSGAPMRSPGAPTTVQAILDNYGSEICSSSIAHGVPPELIVMTIAVETAIYRNDRFTGPATFRWEPNVAVTDVNPITHGDYSAGPMQTLATTARETIGKLNLSYNAFITAPYYSEQPNPAPTSNPLYEGRTNIDLGTAEIKRRLSATGFDPVLVAAAFNAGGLYQSDQNSWCLRSQGNHIDRAVQWFGDACFVLSSLRTAT